jgi:hypothetical protein
MDLNPDQRICNKCNCQPKKEILTEYENLMDLLEEQLLEKAPSHDVAKFCHSMMNRR